jgi:hypothetical protein
MKLTTAEEETRRKYHETEPRFLGTLHERMQHVMHLLRKSVGTFQGITSTDLWHAIHDLELEVSYTTPATPPYGKRTVTNFSVRKSS